MEKGLLLKWYIKGILGSRNSVFLLVTDSLIKLIGDVLKEMQQCPSN